MFNFIIFSKMAKNENILNLNPLEFDSHFFISNWRPPNFGFYQNLHISRIESYRTHLNLPLPPHRRSVHYFMFLKTGKVIRGRGLDKIELKGGEIFFLPAHQINTFDFISEDATGYYCHFRPDIFLQPQLRIDLEANFPFFQLSSDPVLEIRNMEKIEELCLKIEEEYFLSESQRFDLIPIYLFALFSEIKYASTNKTLKTKNAAELITQRYQTALSELLYEKKTVSEFANYLSITANHLNKCVNETTGKSAHDLLQEMRILEAKVLLRQTKLSVADVAFKVGRFESSDFGKFFKKYTKSTPNQYRKMNID